MPTASASVPRLGARTAPLPLLAWTLTYYSRIGRKKLHVAYVSTTGTPRTAALDCWIQFDMDSKPHHARIAWFPDDMDSVTREMLLEDLFAEYTGEATTWQVDTKAQLDAVELAK